jgi:hypothetical protein
MFWGKPKPQKIPYYKPVKSLIPFRGWKWEYFYGFDGAMPLLTSQTVSLDPPAPKKAEPPPKKVKLTPEQAKAQKLEAEKEARQKYLAEQAAKQQKAKEKAEAKGKPKVKEEPPKGEEVKEELPTFSLQDIVLGMEAQGWKKSATLAGRWFGNPALTLPKGDQRLGRPIDDTTITLEWALGFKGVRSRYDELIQWKIYNDPAMTMLKERLKPKIREAFLQAPTRFNHIDTTPFLADLQQFHNTWQFQYNLIGNLDTIGSLPHLLTDFTGALARCNFYTAVGIATVMGDKYFDYDNKKNTKSYCRELTVHVTHIYVYIRDVYEFNNDYELNDNQYLGHWNKTGMILSSFGVVKFTENLPVIRFADGTTLPVDVRRSGRKLYEDHIYWPVHNSDFNEWRNRHQKGGDFVIFTKPVLLKLKKPLVFQMEKLCTPPISMQSEAFC